MCEVNGVNTKTGPKTIIKDIRGARLSHVGDYPSWQLNHFVLVHASKPNLERSSPPLQPAKDVTSDIGVHHGC